MEVRRGRLASRGHKVSFEGNQIWTMVRQRYRHLLKLFRPPAENRCVFMMLTFTSIMVLSFLYLFTSPEGSLPDLNLQLLQLH